MIQGWAQPVFGSQWTEEGVTNLKKTMSPAEFVACREALFSADLNSLILSLNKYLEERRKPVIMAFKFLNNKWSLQALLFCFQSWL